jgi:DNA-binding MarR family transcriptional regulator
MQRNVPPAEAAGDLDEVASLLLRWTSASMRSAQTAGLSQSLRLLADLGTTMPMMVTLHVLALEGPQTMTTMTRRLGLSSSATSHLLQRLVELGLARREDAPADRRQRLLAIAPRGSKAVDDFMTARLAELRHSLAPLSLPTLTALAVALRQVLRELEASGASLCLAPSRTDAPATVLARVQSPSRGTATRRHAAQQRTPSQKNPSQKNPSQKNPSQKNPSKKNPSKKQSPSKKRHATSTRAGKERA